MSGTAGLLVVDDEVGEEVLGAGVVAGRVPVDPVELGLELLHAPRRHATRMRTKNGLCTAGA